MEEVIISNKNYLVDKLQGKVNILKEISDQEFLSVKSAGIRLHEFLHYQRRYKTFEVNYKRFFEVYYSCEQRVSKGSTSPILFDELFVEINTALINLLATFVTLVELIDKTLKRKYGEHSQKYAALKSFLSYFYDSNFSYKFLYHLRNYSIHSNFPIKIIGAKRVMINGTMNHSFYAEFEKSELLLDADFRKKLSICLEKYNETFPVKPIVEGIIKPFEAMFNTILNIEADYFEESARIISNIAETYVCEGDLCLGKFKYSETGYGWNTIIIPISIAKDYNAYKNDLSNVRN